MKFKINIFSLFKTPTSNSRTAVIIKEDPLVDKLTRVNHNLKLVKLKKVKKVYTNLQDNQFEHQNQLSKRPTIVDLNAKSNAVTQTPISFLILDKEFKHDLNENLNEDNYLKLSSDLSSQLNEEKPKYNQFQKEDNFKDLIEKNEKDKKLSKSLILSSRLSKGLDNKEDNLRRNELFKNNEVEKDQTAKSIKVLFPSSANKFKHSFDKPNLNEQSTSNSFVPSNLITTSNPFTSSNKSKVKIDFLNKIATNINRPTIKITTTIKPPTANQTKKFIKSDKYKLYTTTELPLRTFTYKPNKRTTTFQPYIYTPITSTSTPILRIKKSKPTSTTQIKTTVTYKSTLPNSKEFKDDLKNNKINDQKQSLNSNLDKERSDLEPNNSNRKYAKLFFDKDNKEPITTIAKPLSTKSYLTANLRTNSRVSTYSSFTPYYTTTTQYTTTNQYTTTENPEIKKNYYQIQTTTESIVKNEISRNKILTAIRKRPIYRPKPRTVTPNQLKQLLTTTSSKIEQNKPEVTTESSFSLTTTTYSPRFRSTTTYSPSFRSTTTTESSVDDRFTIKFKYTTTPSLSNSLTTANYHKETSFYKSKLDEDTEYATDLPARIATTELLSTFKNDLISNLIPRKSKWILKGTRQRKSDYTDDDKELRDSYSNKYTKPINYYLTTDEPIVRSVTRPSTFELSELDETNRSPEYKVNERALKSIEPSYQARSPEPFLISRDENEKEIDRPETTLKLKYEEPRRLITTNSIDTSPDKEIYYQDVKVRKESKLVPQTYLYSTSSPATIDKLNERLLYLNEEQAKYQRMPTYLNNNYYQKQRAEEERKPTTLSYADEQFENRPKYPNNLSYSPLDKKPNYQNTRYNYENSKPYLEKDTSEQVRSNLNQPYIRTHFNLGPPANEIPKYGNLFKQVGKLSKPFTNQAPIPFIPEKDVKNKENYPDQPIRYPISEQQNYNIDLKRYPNRDHQPKFTNYPISSHANDEDKNRIKSETMKPFDFSNYKPLPNAKFIRTDLESEIPNNNNKYKDEYRPFERPSDRPIINEYHLNNHNTRPENTHYSAHFNNQPDRGTARFNFNKIPAKVVYDKYNQKFSGRINLKPIKYLSTPKHYAEIPEHVRPIEYRPTMKPTYAIDPSIRNKPIINNNYQNNNQNPSDFNRHSDERPTYRPINKFNNHQNNQPKQHIAYNNNLNNSRFIYPNRYNQEVPRNQRTQYYSDAPKYPIYNQFNNNEYNNQLNKNQLNNYNQRPQFNQETNPQFTNQRKPFYNNQFNENQFNNAGHYKNQLNKPTKEIELINLNDIEPSLFNDGYKPDFKLLQHSVISHDIPSYNTYNLA